MTWRHSLDQQIKSLAGRALFVTNLKLNGNLKRVAIWEEYLLWFEVKRIWNCFVHFVAILFYSWQMRFLLTQEFKLLALPFPIIRCHGRSFELFFVIGQPKKSFSFFPSIEAILILTWVIESHNEVAQNVIEVNSFCDGSFLFGKSKLKCLFDM